MVLVKGPRDIPEHRHGFARYQRLRRERVEKVMPTPADAAATRPRDPWPGVFRDAMMPLT